MVANPFTTNLPYSKRHSSDQSLKFLPLTPSSLTS